MAQIAADGLINLCCPGIVFCHQLLDSFQLFSRRCRLIQLDSGSGSQFDHAVLGEVFHAAADIAGPFIDHGVGVRIHRNERKLIEPACNAAFLVYVAYCLAGAHGNTQDIVVL